MPKRIAIIGAGFHAQGQHYPVLGALPEIDLVAACDLVPDKLAAVQQKYGIPAVFSDYREMLDRAAPEAVVIVLQPMPLVPIALDCLDRGVDLMIEKPPGCTSAEAEQILARAEARGRKVMVSLNRRFMPLVRRLRDMALERGLVACSATYHKDGFFADRWTWPGSLPVCDAIHLIDLVRFIGGEVAEVHACAAAREASFTNAHAALVVHENGAMSTLQTHHCVGARVHRFELHGHGLSAYLDVGDTDSPGCELYLDGQPAEPPQDATELPAGVARDNYHETRHFLDFLAGAAPESDLADALVSVRLCEAIAEGYRGPLSEFRAARR